MLRSQTHAKHTARAINEFTAFIHCELSRSETRKRPDHKLIASTMCALRFETHSENRLDEGITPYCAFATSQNATSPSLFPTTYSTKYILIYLNIDT